jgi:hypothetical protein
VGIGTPRTRITPDLAAAHQGHGHWGVQPSGPLFVSRKPRAKRGSMVKTAVTGTPHADAALPLPRFMPKAAALDYAHKLTTTTLLLAGVVGYFLFGRSTARSTLRKLGRKHIG